MIAVERYDVRVNGACPDAVALRRLGALAVTLALLDDCASGITSILILEHETGEARACWVRTANTWRVAAVPGWLS